MAITWAGDTMGCRAAGFSGVVELPFCRGRSRRIYCRSVAVVRVPLGQLSAGVQWRFYTLISGDGFKVYKSDFGSDPVGLFEWGEKGDAQDASPPGQFARQSEFRLAARRAAMKEVANSKWRRLLPYTDVRRGASALFYETVRRKSAPRWRGPAEILGRGETGVTVTINV